MWKTRAAFSKVGGKGGKAVVAFPRFPRTGISTAAGTKLRRLPCASGWCAENDNCLRRSR